VRLGGSDTNDGLTVGTALATIQEAINRVPKFIKHQVTIDIGEGSFAGFYIAGFIIAEYVNFYIQGTLGNPTLTTGLVSGTATGGSTTQLIDISNDWVDNELRGMLVNVEGTYRQVYSNTNDTINFVGAYGSSVNGKAYEIFEQKTVIDSGNGLLSYARATLSACAASTTSRMNINNIKFDGGASAAICLYIFGTLGCRCERLYATGATTTNFVIQDLYAGASMRDCYSTDSYYGFQADRSVGKIEFDRTFAYNNSNHGYICGNNVQIDGGAVYAQSNGAAGMKFETVMWVDIDSGIIEDNTGYGIDVDTNDSGNRGGMTFLNAVGNITIQNNTAGGIVGRNRSTINLTNVDGSNGNYGIVLEVDSVALITSATGITGGSGDATINGGNTILAYATHFVSDRDVAVNTFNGCRIERKD
jgi:hypothetical protein